MGLNTFRKFRILIPEIVEHLKGEGASLREGRRVGDEGGEGGKRNKTPGSLFQIPYDRGGVPEGGGKGGEVGGGKGVKGEIVMIKFGSRLS